MKKLYGFCILFLIICSVSALADNDQPMINNQILKINDIIKQDVQPFFSWWGDITTKYFKIIKINKEESYLGVEELFLNDENILIASGTWQDIKRITFTDLKKEKFSLHDSKYGPDGKPTPMIFYNGEKQELKIKDMIKHNYESYWGWGETIVRYYSILKIKTDSVILQKFFLDGNNKLIEGTYQDIRERSFEELNEFTLHKGTYQDNAETEPLPTTEDDGSFTAEGGWDIDLPPPTPTQEKTGILEIDNYDFETFKKRSKEKRYYEIEKILTKAYNKGYRTSKGEIYSNFAIALSKIDWQIKTTLPTNIKDKFRKGNLDVKADLVDIVETAWYASQYFDDQTPEVVEKTKELKSLFEKFSLEFEIDSRESADESGLNLNNIITSPVSPSTPRDRITVIDDLTEDALVERSYLRYYAGINNPDYLLDNLCTTNPDTVTTALLVKTRLKGLLNYTHNQFLTLERRRKINEKITAINIKCSFET